MHGRGKATVDAAFGLIYSFTRNTSALSISPIQGTIQLLFRHYSGSSKLLRKQKCQIKKLNVLGRKALGKLFLKLEA